MNEGTVYSLIRFPGAWPPVTETTLIAGQLADTAIRLIAHPDGHLSLLGPCRYSTQRINLSGTGFALITVVWKDAEVGVYINGEPLKSLQTAASEVFEITLRERRGEGPVSFEHPDAKANCKKWTDWRKARYANPKLQPKAQRRLKTDDEQIDELSETLKALEDLARAVQAGNLRFLEDVAGRLRSAVYWQEGSKNYNPILLRLAGRLGLPLPVFAFPDKIPDEPPIIRDAAFQYTSPIHVTLQKTYPAQELMDLQQWLESEVQVQRFEEMHGSVAERVERSVTAKQLILDFSTTLGNSHYDDDVPLALDALQILQAGQVNALSKFIIDVALVVVSLGRWVLCKWAETQKLAS
jgi:hypothetical protein